MASNGVTYRFVQDFIFRTFEPEGTATLARVIAAVDRFSLWHRTPHVLDFGKASSLARTLTTGQLLCLCDLIRDGSQLLGTGQQFFQQLLPIIHCLLVISALKCRAACQV